MYAVMGAPLQDSHAETALWYLTMSLLPFCFHSCLGPDLRNATFSLMTVHVSMMGAGTSESQDNCEVTSLPLPLQRFVKLNLGCRPVQKAPLPVIAQAPQMSQKNTLTMIKYI